MCEVTVNEAPQWNAVLAIAFPLVVFAAIVMRIEISPRVSCLIQCVSTCLVKSS